MGRIFTVLVLFVALSGCSALQFAYKNADTLLQWRGGQYFDFEGEARTEYERRVQRFLDWHRRTALPQYARHAEDVAQRLARGLSRADLDWGYDVFRAQMQQSLRAGSAEVAELLDGLSPAQFETFEKRLEKENRDYAKESRLGETPEERRAMRVKRNVERFEDWFGAMTDAQVERVRLYSERAPLDDMLRDRDRKRLQKELLAMLRAKQAKQRLAQWAANWEQNREPEYDVARKQNLQEYFAMVLDLDRMLSAAQRVRAVKRLRGFAGDFTALAADGGAR